MLARVSSREAPPLKRPAGLASFTRPVARAPLGIQTLPSTSMGAFTVAEKFCPGRLILDPTDSSKTTVITVSAGTTTGFGRAAASRAAVLEAEAPPAAPESGEGEAASLEACCC